MTTKDVSLVFLAVAIVIAAISIGKTVLTESAGTDRYTLYQQVGKIAASDYREQNMLHNSPIVMVMDAAGYYYATGQHAVLWPTQNLATVLEAAQTYSVSYLLVTPNYEKEGQLIWRTTLTDSRLKLIWSSPSGKLYRFFSSSKATIS